MGGERRRSVPFIAHSRPLRRLNASQGLRGKWWAGYLLQAKRRHIAAARSLCAVLCCVRSPRTSLARAARSVTCANGFRPVPAHSCATDGCGVSTRAFCRDERSASLRNQSRGSLHVDTSAPPPSHTTPPHQHPPLEPHPTLRRPLAYAGCNPEFARPRKPFAFCFDDRSV